MCRYIKRLHKTKEAKLKDFVSKMRHCSLIFTQTLINTLFSGRKSKIIMKIGYGGGGILVTLVLICYIVGGVFSFM